MYMYIAYFLLQTTHQDALLHSTVLHQTIHLRLTRRKLALVILLARVTRWRLGKREKYKLKNLIYQYCIVNLEARTCFMWALTGRYVCCRVHSWSVIAYWSRSSTASNVVSPFSIS